MPSFTDELAAATARAFTTGDPGPDALTFTPTLNPWVQHLWGTEPAPKPAEKRPALQEAVAVFPRKSAYAVGNEIADNVASAKGVDVLSGNRDWLAIAKTQVGVPYSWSDLDPKGGSSGFDCSGFTKWVYQRAFGVNLPHLSSGQQDQLKFVTAKNLKPGDLLFFRYTDRNGGGDTADHVAIYIGNGQQIGTPSSAGGVGVQNVDWSAFVGGGASPATIPVVPHKTTAQVPRETGVFNPSLVGTTGDWVPNLEGPAAMAHVTANAHVAARSGIAPDFGVGTKAEVKSQLYQGFIDAGHPELARMVKTKAFDTWINAESGWRVDSVSQVYAGHGRNFGLFQFWDGHPWTGDYYTSGAWTASAYQQAKMAAQYFSLTPQDIRTYAEQINSGNYSGWG